MILREQLTIIREFMETKSIKSDLGQPKNYSNLTNFFFHDLTGPKLFLFKIN